jgi:hypothetical protein
MRFRRVFFVLLTGLFLTLHGLATAHTDLLRSEPEDGSEVESLDAVHLFFAGSLSDAEVRVLFLSDEVPLTTEIDESGTQVTATLNDEAEQGNYQVVWSVATAEDGHTISGSFSFEYDAPPTPNEMRAGIVLLVGGSVAFIMMLAWQRRMAAIKSVQQP